jgi:peptide chain release factor subunit 1
MAIMMADLETMLDQFKGPGLVVSCYADLSARPGIPFPWPGPFKLKAAAIKKLLAEDAGASLQFDDDFKAIGRAFGAEEAIHARGMAVFSARERGFFKAIPLDVPLMDDLVVDQSPYLVPLLQLLFRQKEYLVVLSDTHRGRLYAAAPGGVRLLRMIEEAVPAHQHSAGECWGTQQATIARHRLDRILHFQKLLADMIDMVQAETHFQGVILFGEHETVEHLRKHLPARLADRVVHEGRLEWTEDATEIAAELSPILAELEREEESATVQGLAKRLRDGGGVACGTAAVLEALYTGTVGPRGHGYLVVGPDPRELVSRCTACRSLHVDMAKACPRCQAPCVEANLWEELLLFALRHDISVRCVKANETISLCDGVAAFLPGVRGS